MAKVWMTAAIDRDDIEIVGLVDLNVKSAEALATEYFPEQMPLISSELDATLAELSPDVVFDCTVPVAHEHITLTALKAGCHVLGEKPLAPTMEAANRMVQAAKESGKLYAVIQNRRYLKNIWRIKQLLESGVLGEIHTVNADFYMGPHFGGFRDEMDNVLLLDMAIHTFDQARFVLGDPVCAKVFCHEYNPPGSWYAHGASAQAIFSFESGAVFNYRGSWAAEGLPTSWQSQWRIVGTKGTLTWDGDETINAEIVVGNEGFIHDTESVPVPDIDFKPEDEGHAGVIGAFLESIHNGTVPMTHCENNILSLAMVHGAIESAKTGIQVEL